MIYPEELEMQKVERWCFLSDDLERIVLVDVLESGREHTYTVLCNTDEKGRRVADNLYAYPESGIHYQVVGSQPLDYAQDEHEYITHTYPGLYDGTPIGILGVGAIGRNVVRLLKPFAVSIRAYDPFLSDGDAARLGVAKTSLEEVFSDCQVVSNHLANNEQTKGMLDYRLFSRM